jgi:hypothetical protein
VWPPHGPEKAEVRSFVFMDEAAPPEGKKAIRQAGIRGFSASGSFEQVDMDSWQECTQTCRGVVSRRIPPNTQMGLGHDRFDPALGAWVSDYRFSDSNHRQFYRRWAALMEAPDADARAGTAAREASHA